MLPLGAPAPGRRPPRLEAGRWMLDAGLLVAGWPGAGRLSLVGGVSGISDLLSSADQEIVRGWRVSAKGVVAGGALTQVSCLDSELPSDSMQ